MKKLQIDLVSILVLALIVTGAILIWGEYAGIKTPEARSVCLSTVEICALILAFLASFDRLGRWSDATRSLGKWLLVSFLGAYFNGPPSDLEKLPAFTKSMKTRNGAGKCRCPG
jgi:hypothetical protein